MHSIPENFFESETRLSFEITSTMKKAWAVQLTLLDQILEIAQSAGIKLWMDYGSLLGAIRHNGYIPWDDDIDICIMREDYIGFLFLLRRKLPECCRVRSFYTTENYTQPKAFISNRDVIDIGKDPEQKEITEKYFGIPYVAGVDLYPLDYVPRDEAQWNLIRSIYMAVYDLAMSFDVYRENGELEGYVSQIEELLNVQLKRDYTLRSSLWKLADSVAMMTKKEEADSVIWYPDSAMRHNDMRRPLSCYTGTDFIDFEFLKVPVPSGYHEILQACYGEDYMTPVRAESTHGYPFYKEQDEIIARHST